MQPLHVTSHNSLPFVLPLLPTAPAMCPLPSQMGGSEALIGALIRGLEKHGGRLLLRSHVDNIVVENGRAVGVALRPPTSGSKAASNSSSSGQPEFIRARKGVISNASVWDTQKLLAPGVGPKEWRRQSITTPQVCGCCSAGVFGASAVHVLPAAVVSSGA